MLQGFSWSRRASGLLLVVGLLAVPASAPLHGAAPAAKPRSPSSSSSSRADTATDAKPSAERKTADDTKSAATAKPRVPNMEVPIPGLEKGGILFIGDSMSVGGFGESLRSFFTDRYGKSRVAMYASCGSSPEHWLTKNPVYYTRCGYMEVSPVRSVSYDFENHRPPPATPTPKLENLLRQFEPLIVVIQLGTNWMDQLDISNTQSVKNHYSDVLDQFVDVLRHQTKSVQQVIWITPPDSSKYTPNTKRTVDALIKDCAHNWNFDTIDSATMTHYIAGKTGGDGVHYTNQAANHWAEQVRQEMEAKLQ